MLPFQGERPVESLFGVISVWTQLPRVVSDRLRGQCCRERSHSSAAASSKIRK